MSRNRLVGVSLLATAALTLAGCAGGGENTGGAESSAADQTRTTATSEATAGLNVPLDRGVVRATTEENPMTSVFGTLQNNTGEEITIVGLSADVEAETYEIHEVVNGTMQEKQGGITIPAGETHEMNPGGDHFMFMGLTHPLGAGDAVTVTLELADGSTTELPEIPVRTMGAGDEDYGDLGMAGRAGDHDTSGTEAESGDGRENEH